MQLGLTTRIRARAGPVMGRRQQRPPHQHPHLRPLPSLLHPRRSNPQQRILQVGMEKGMERESRGGGGAAGGDWVLGDSMRRRSQPPEKGSHSLCSLPELGGGLTSGLVSHSRYCCPDLIPSSTSTSPSDP